MKIRRLLFLFSLSFPFLLFSQTKADVEKIVQNYDLDKLNELQAFYKNKQAAEKKLAYDAAERNGWPIIVEKEGVYQELMKLTPDGFPLYYSTTNVAAARSTRTNFLNSGGGLGLSLDGQNMVARVWDGGTVRRSHNGFSGRVITVDDEFGTSYSQHATHVTGTMIASPWNSTSNTIKGMASLATARTFNWDLDESEALSEVLLGMLVSNHSYGVPLTGSNGPLPAWYIGSYVPESREWDEITYYSPFYLPVYSAGNDGENSGNADPIASGYDKLIGNKVSKNVLTVANAQDADIASNGSLVSVFINSSSSQGPTDDRRIKPDITGNGSGVSSLGSFSDTSLATLSGTSMASPNVSGTLLLLQQHYKNISSNFMRAATLKGLVCHTADDAGDLGPDPIFGWGLLNAKRAAETISGNGITSWISEEKITQGQTQTFQVRSAGGANNPLIATISWTDLPGEANNGQRSTPNDLFKALVNDLDIRISRNGGNFLPWRLNLVDGLTAVRNIDNDVDNIEQVKIDLPEAGDYIITISHKGNLVTGAQNYSLIVTGIVSNIALIPTSDNLTLCSTSNATFTFSYNQVGGGTTNFSAIGLPNGASAIFTPSSLSSSGNVSVSISGLSSVTPGDYIVGIIANNGNEIETRNRYLKVYSSNFTAVNLISPINNLNGASTILNLVWGRDVNAENYQLQLSTSPTFGVILLQQTTTNSSFILRGLQQQTTYYWRVIPSNRCGTGSVNNATISSFTTGILSCGNSFTATDFSNATIATTANAMASVPVSVSGGLNIGDLKVSLTMTHTWVQDVTIKLRGPAAIGSPVVTLLREACGSQDNINCTFTEFGSDPQCSSTPPAIFDLIAPFESLSNFNGLIADGIWTLIVEDPHNNDGGLITNFRLEVCNITLSNRKFIFDNLKVYPNPSKGIIHIDLSENLSGETTFELFDVQGRQVVTKKSSNSIETLNVENLSEGIYMLTIENDLGKTTRKVVINK